jgi:5-formyltetrahydrofolate cyclo-ligase
MLLSRQHRYGEALVIDIDVQLRDEIDDKLKHAGDSVYSKLPLPPFPQFKTAAIAATNLLRLFPAALYNAILVMRDRCLRAVREFALRDRTLIVPDKLGERLVQVPRHALYDTSGAKVKSALVIDPLPYGSTLYVGDIQLVVVGCLAFSLTEPRLFGFDCCATEGSLERLRDDLLLRPNVIIVALASDAQEVSGWPEAALSDVVVHAIITPSRIIIPETGDVFNLRADGLSGEVGL